MKAYNCRRQVMTVGFPPILPVRKEQVSYQWALAQVPGVYIPGSRRTNSSGGADRALVFTSLAYNYGVPSTNESRRFYPR